MSHRHSPAILPVWLEKARFSACVGYAALVQEGVLKPDTEQATVVASLDELCQQLGSHQQAMKQYVQDFSRWRATRDAAEKAENERRREEPPSRMGLLRKRLADLGAVTHAPPPQPAELSDEALGILPAPSVPTAPLGRYIHGGVGTGKSLLMDLLFVATRGVVRHRRRVHFNTLLLEVHARLNQHSTQRRCQKQAGAEAEGSASATHVHPLEMVARELVAAPGSGKAGLAAAVAASDVSPPPASPSQPSSAATEDAGFGSENSPSQSLQWRPDQENALLLCFDEFQLNEVGDAVIVRSLLQYLFEMGVVVVTTSNRPPTELNRNRLQAADFEVFLAVLRQRCEILTLDATEDYRHLHAEADQEAEQTCYAAATNSQSDIVQARVALEAVFVHLAIEEQNTMGKSHPPGSSNSLKGAAGVAEVESSSAESQFIGKQMELPVMFGRQLVIQRAVGA